ncbi:MAG: hypothetical protein UX43_C0015G0004 [Candidatus Giovannonibacteria bacterium GW2011_GWB1_46_20]|nr:MAG: hypothetical protein UX43_C0015G0004 [Candidatus Giovannonibacteria bacterium GW2011_GWB1_46_20]
MILIEAMRPRLIPPCRRTRRRVAEEATTIRRSRNAAILANFLGFTNDEFYDSLTKEFEAGGFYERGIAAH